ncbi:uncharacterized protein ACRADG_002030 [Cochliomyia hominivorax]
MNYNLFFRMYSKIVLLFVVCENIMKVRIITAFNENKCPFKDTINLTDHKPHENGSYEYQGILIPPEKQHFYNYDLKFLETNYTVPLHLRGCVCDNKPCTKLCCKPGEYLVQSANSSSCEKILSNMKVSWQLPIELNSGQIEVVNIFEKFTTQVGTPCEKPMPLNPASDKWILEEDGILFIESDDSAIDTINYCYSLVKNSGEYIVSPFSCPIEDDVTWYLLLNTYAMTLSIIFLVPTIVVYLVLKELRGNLSGKLLISYLISLTIAYSVISLINISHIRFGIVWCTILGYGSYFFFMAAFLWLSVLCFDVLMTFRDSNISANSGTNRMQFIYYSMYAWFIAAIETGILAYIQLSPAIDPYYKPDLSKKRCWINTSKWSAAYYFYGPNFIIILFNMGTFVHLTRKIYIVRRNSTRLTQRDNFLKENAIVISRLFLIMGVSWIFEILSFCLLDYEEELRFLFILSDLFNASQGVLIFSLFILKPRILKRLRHIKSTLIWHQKVHLHQPQTFRNYKFQQPNIRNFLIKMYNSAILLLISQLFLKLITISAVNDDICPFKNTVNLTDFPSSNGSYDYQGISIPPEKQKYYEYDLKFKGKRIKVPKHLRGCVCEQKPCIKLCCNQDEYFVFSDDTSSCERITPEMELSWNLEIELKGGKTKNVDLFEHFTTIVGLPCLEPEPFDPTLDEWTLNEDGTISLPEDEEDLDLLNYCYSFDNVTGEFILTPYSCSVPYEPPKQQILKTWAMTISIIFLIPTILVYLVLKELRGNLRGKLLLSYLCSLTIGYIMISIMNFGVILGSIMCYVVGFTTYFFFMAAFLWLSVLCYDIWMNFKETNIELNPNKNQKKFIRYSLYAWLSAGFATVILIFIQMSPSLPLYLKPEIGGDYCWINTSKWSSAIYFYGPNLIILIFNMITFIHLTRKIYIVRTDLARITHKDKFLRENAIVILRLFLIMGVSWLFDILSFCMRDYKSWDILFLLTDLANGIQGILIFSLFVLKPKILRLLRRLFQKDQFKQPRKSTSTSSTHFSKVPISTDGTP